MKKGDLVKIVAGTPYHSSDYGWDGKKKNSLGKYGVIVDGHLKYADTQVNFWIESWKIRFIDGSYGIWCESDLHLMAES